MKTRAFLRELLQTTAQRVGRKPTAWRQLLKIVAELQACLSCDEAYHIITRGAQSLFPATSGVLYVRRDPGDFQVQSVSTWGRAVQTEPLFKLHQCQALRLMKVVEHAQAVPVCQHVGAPSGGSYVCVPLMAECQASGLLHLQDGARGLTPLEKQLAQALAEQSALALRNLYRRRELEERATRDSLTGLYNRYFMQDSLERELTRAARGKQPVGIIMLDIDYFKRFNTRFTWLGGDALLRDFGRFLQQQVRGEDIACRYAGEEFLLILPGASLKVARQRAERLRLAVKQLIVRDEDRVLDPVSLSLGVAAFPRHGTTPNAVLRAAAGALLRAKTGGRDRVVLAGASQSVCGG
jgi:diguanylate cyclase (GGDEF)-like protein